MLFVWKAFFGFGWEDALCNLQRKCTIDSWSLEAVIKPKIINKVVPPLDNIPHALGFMDVTDINLLFRWFAR